MAEDEWKWINFLPINIWLKWNAFNYLLKSVCASVSNTVLLGLYKHKASKIIIDITLTVNGDHTVNQSKDTRFITNIMQQIV